MPEAKQEIIQSFWVLWQPANEATHGPAYAGGNAFHRGGIYLDNGIYTSISNNPWIYDNDEEYGDNDGCVACRTFNSFSQAYTEGKKLHASGLPYSYYVPRLVQTTKVVSEQTSMVDVGD